jgi:hypothetical protein
MSQVRAVLRQVTVFTQCCLGNECDAVCRHRGLLCNNARCSLARDGTARHGEDTAPPPHRAAHTWSRGT